MAGISTGSEVSAGRAWGMLAWPAPHGASSAHERWRGLLRTCCPLGRGAVDTGSWSQRLTAGLNLRASVSALGCSVSETTSSVHQTHR